MTNKPQTKSECINAIIKARDEYGIIPETLMVFGHNNAEDEISLRFPSGQPDDPRLCHRGHM